MKRILLLTVLLTTGVGFAWGFYHDWDPLGEKSDYVIVKTGNRTSAIVQSGTANAEVVEERVSKEDFLVTVKFNIRSAVGNRTGEFSIGVPWAYYEQGFIEYLKSVDFIQTDEYKMKHMGTKSVTLYDGRLFQNCDLILIYDLDQEIQFGDDVLGNPIFMTDTSLLATVFPGIPTLGAVQLDVKGRYAGLDLKLGTDLKAE